MSASADLLRKAETSLEVRGDLCHRAGGPRKICIVWHLSSNARSIARTSPLALPSPAIDMCAPKRGIEESLLVPVSGLC